jgi:uncharacterized protein (DUF927 family)
MSVSLDSGAPAGFVVNSFAEDDPLECRDYVRMKVGLPPFRADKIRPHRLTHTNVEAAIVAALQETSSTPPRLLVATYDYTDQDGNILYQVVRYEPKTFRYRRPDGAGGWITGVGERRVPYRWPDILAHSDATVFVCEGEKDADRVASLGHCATTVASGKWTRDCIRAFAGRDIFIMQDNDEPGRKKALEAAFALHNTARSIRIVRLPDLLPRGDVSDWLDAESSRVSELVPICCATPPWLPDQSDGIPSIEVDSSDGIGQSLPAGYIFTENRLMWIDPADCSKRILIAGTFEVAAETRDVDGGSWGILLRWNDNDGRDQELALARATLAGDGCEARRLLMDRGLFIAPDPFARKLLNAFLLQVRSANRVRATQRGGWHSGKFVLPDACFSVDESETYVLQGGTQDHAFRQLGTLDNWTENIARYATGNSRLLLAISSAFAAPLLESCVAESGVIHFNGPSSIAKTTHLHVAGSVWGGGEINGYPRSWRATANGLEGIAAAHCDTLLCLDELSQLAGKEAGQVAYMLANGQGKSRSSRDGLARRAARWRILVLSSGEIGLADKVSEDGRARSTAGQQVRVVDVPADAGAGLGMFEQLHDFPTAEALARHLRDATRQSYGVASREYLRAIIPQMEQVRQRAREIIGEFVKASCPEGADGQVYRVAQRFGLIAAGGEIACACNIVPWQPGEVIRASAQCFTDWLEARGGHEAAEARIAIEQIRGFLLAHGLSRFVAWGEQAQTMRDVTGFRKQAGETWDYYFHSAGWKNACSGLDPRRTAAILFKRAYLVRGEEKGFSKAMRVPGYGKLRLYHVLSTLLEGDGGSG